MAFLGFLEVLLAFAAYYIENCIASLDFNTQLTAALTMAAVNITVASVSLVIALYRFRWMRPHLVSNIFHLLLAVCGSAIATMEMMKIGFGFFEWMPEFLPAKVAWTIFLILIVEESLTQATNNYVEVEYVDIVGRLRVASPIPFLVSVALCLCVWSFVVYSSAAPLQSRSDVQWKSYGKQIVVVREEILDAGSQQSVWQDESFSPVCNEERTVIIGFTKLKSTETSIAFREVAAKDPGGPAVEPLPERQKWKSYGNELPWKRILVVREEMLLKKNVDAGSQQSVWQELKRPASVQRALSVLEMEVEQINIGKYEHYMQKEIHEQPESLTTTMRGRLIHGGTCKARSDLLGGLKDLRTIRRSRRMVFIGCGTSYNAALAARPILEELSGVPVTMEIASDLVDRQGPIYREDTTVFVSQSGETADTLQALEYALEKGALCVGITNTVGSAITRHTHCGVHINADCEIGVSSTKAYRSQIVVMAILALAIGDDMISSQARHGAIIDGLFDLPNKVKEALKLDEEMKDLAQLLIAEQSLLVFRRGYNFATALEGALKVKEIALMHSEGILAGEMKHGPLALVDETLPIVVINIIPQVPQVEDCLQPVINIIPLQKKQKMHLSMYEDDQCASERLRCSQRFISFKEHSRKSREESSSSDFQTDEDKQYDYTADSPTYLSNSSYHQADLPRFQGKDYESESKWLGTEVWPLDVAEQRKTTLIQRERIGKGRQESCGCQFVGSTECVRFHIREKRLKLKLELGSAF